MTKQPYQTPVVEPQDQLKAVTEQDRVLLSGVAPPI